MFLNNQYVYFFIFYITFWVDCRTWSWIYHVTAHLFGTFIKVHMYTKTTRNELFIAFCYFVVKQQRGYMLYDKYDDIKWNSDNRNEITQINKMLNKRRDDLKFSTLLGTPIDKTTRFNTRLFHFIIICLWFKLFQLFILKLYLNTSVK